MVLERVDVVYRTEARIALNRFHQANLPDAGLGAQSLSLTEDLKLVQVAPFANLTSAMDYWTAVREAAARDLFPWLPAATYRFLPVSLPNLELLLRNRDINAYLAFLHTSLPDQF
jgi:hypothetical protein